ncbi:hypothetical protein [Clostridium sp. DJ247]|uniref:hypothetical protein n=1 Tax=Clostridium sp. DJ247 TaxID=2726188 RepID=UPI0016261405|nr:hypothetical protein [Clostridium sp. DJ247]MBC2582288.1 hypothetical protein [Clostridium sp. DJ247]
MRIPFNKHFNKIFNKLRADITRLAGVDIKSKYIEIDTRTYKVGRVVSNICSAEIVFSFIYSSKKKEIQIDDIFQLFRVTANSDVPYFDDYDKKMVTILQNTLYHWSYKNSLEQVFAEYEKYPNEWKILNVNRLNGKLNSISIKTDVSSLDRFKEYISELERPLAHENRIGLIDEKEFKNSDLKHIYYKDSNGKNEVHIELEDNLIAYCKDKYRFQLIDTEAKQNEGININKDDLIAWACEMDEKDKVFKLKNNWEGRIKDLVFSIPSDKGLIDNKNLYIDGILHTVGALSVGKSTFTNICTYGITKHKGKIVTIFLNTVSDVFKSIDYFNMLQVKAVPFLSINQIHEHANQYITTLKTQHEIFKNRKSFRYINDSCMLLNTKLDSEKELAEEWPPCNGLYIKEENSRGNIIDKKIVCPFISICPKYNNIRDLNEAQVIVTTINSAVQAYLPFPYTDKHMTILEYIMRKSNLVFIDESDQVQANLDAMFCKELMLYGDKNIFYRETKNRVMEYQEQGDVPDDENIIQFIRGTTNVEYFTTNVANFITTTVQVDKLFKRNIFDEIVKSQLLWRDMFDEAINVNNNIKKTFDKNTELSSLYNKARKAFINTFTRFQRDLLNGESARDKNNVVEDLRIIAANLADESKLILDLQHLSNFKLNELLLWEDEEKLNREDFKELDGLYSNWEKPLNQIVSRSMEKLKFIIDLYMLEHKLKHVLEKWDLVKKIDSSIIDGKNGSPGGLRKEFAGLVPVIPIDMNYGFIIKKDNGKIKISYKNIEGVGRWILLNFDKLYSDLDDIKTNCILLSGTSNMKTSPKYNINLPIGCLLRKPQVKKTKLFMYYPASIAVKVSGTKYIQKREALKNVANKLFDESLSIDGKAYLEGVYDRLTEGRKRVLFSLGSYDDCRIFTEELSENMKDAFTLVKNGNLNFNSKNEIERSKIEDIAKYNIKAMAIPLGIGRGYNINTEILDYINELKGEEATKSVAAIEAAFFIKRPYYIPNDISTMVSWFNNAYVNEIYAYTNREYEDIKEFHHYLLSSLYKAESEFENMFGYSSLSDYARNNLLGDTIVDVFQLACRLIRGNVNAEVHFMDSSFAPGTAANDEGDTVKTSMLIGWREMIKNMIYKATSISEGQIAEELYYMLLEGFEMLNLKERG